MEHYFNKYQVYVFYFNDEYKQNQYVVWCVSAYMCILVQTNGDCQA